jgi:hypothetical protein
MTSSFNIPAQGGQYFRYCSYFGWLIFAGALMDWIVLQKKTRLVKGQNVPTTKEGQFT